MQIVGMLQYVGAEEIVLRAPQMARLKTKWVIPPFWPV